MEDSDPWCLLQECNTRLQKGSIEGQFEREPGRGRRLTHTLGGLRVDLSRNCLDEGAWAALLNLARARRLEAGIEALLAGEKINRSEGRPALHSALRSPPIAANAGMSSLVEDMQGRMFRLAEDFRGGRWRGGSGEPITDLVNIGIGGSDLGPKLVVEALQEADSPGIHFLANIDGAAIAALLPRLNPATTAFCVTSKSFSTLETLTNAASARTWLQDRLGLSGEALGRHFVAVTARPERAAQLDIPASRVLPMWDWVGGRYSLWSAVGLPIAAAIGSNGFRQLLAGAALVDNHFQSAPASQNLPVLLALLGIWFRNVEGLLGYAVVPYDERLKFLPEYLQQLDMESNGKSVGAAGEPLQRATGPLIWGGIGSNAQHAFFQWLHQGSDVVPVDLIAAREPDHAYPEHHRQLMANLLAQATALMRGRGLEQTRELLRSQGLSEAQIKERAPQCSFSGNRPSNIMLLERLCPHALGSLLALYEHKVFVQAWIWGINAFDQWGVELGKTLASHIEPCLTDRRTAIGDDSLDHWLEWLNSGGPE